MIQGAKYARGLSAKRKESEQMRVWCPQCDSGSCEDCPRYMDDCDGKDEDDNGE